MQERPRQDVSDGVSWWCSTCKGRKTIQDVSFLRSNDIHAKVAANHIYVGMTVLCHRCCRGGRGGAPYSHLYVSVAARSVQYTPTANSNCAGGARCYCSN